MAKTFFYFLSLWVLILSPMGVFASEDGFDGAKTPNKRPFAVMEHDNEASENSSPQKIRKLNSSPLPVHVSSSEDIIEFFKEPHGMDLVELCKNNTDLFAFAIYTYSPTLLHYAARFGHIDVVKYLSINFPWMVFHNDSNGSTALYIACQFGQLDVVKYFCENIDDLLKVSYAKDQSIISPPLVPDATVGTCLSAIYPAVAHGHLNVIDYLCQTNPWLLEDASITGGYSVIHHAVEHNQLKTVVYFCKNQPQLITRVAYVAGTILHLSAFKKHKSILNYLCKFHPYLKDIYFTQDFTPLHQAVGFDQLDIILFLVPHFPEILSIGRHIQASPLEFAFSNNKEPAAMLLYQLEAIYTHGWAGNKDIQDMTTLSLSDLLAITPDVLDYVVQQYPCNQERINHLISFIESHEMALKTEHEKEKIDGKHQKAKELLKTIEQLKLYKDIYLKYTFPDLKNIIISTMTIAVQSHSGGFLQAQAYQQILESMKADDNFMDIWRNCLPWTRMNTETPEEFLNILQPFPKAPEPMDDWFPDPSLININWEEDFSLPPLLVWEDDDLSYLFSSIKQKVEKDNVDLTTPSAEQMVEDKDFLLPAPLIFNDDLPFQTQGMEQNDGAYKLFSPFHDMEDKDLFLSPPSPEQKNDEEELFEEKENQVFSGNNLSE